VYTYFMTEFLPVIPSPPLDRQRYSIALKRQMVEASFVPGASIASVALSYGVNANLLHKWRSRYRHGEFGAVSAPSGLTAMQMVKPARLAAAKLSQQTTISTNAKPSSYIELLFNNIRVLVHGAPDGQTLRNVIDVLRT
jgi:transposase